MNIKQLIICIFIIFFSYYVNARDNYSLQTGTHSVLNKVQKDIEEGKNEALGTVDADEFVEVEESVDAPDEISPAEQKEEES